MEAKLEMLNINVFSSEDMKLCGNDVNIVRVYHTAGGENAVKLWKVPSRNVLPL